MLNISRHLFFIFSFLFFSTSFIWAKDQSFGERLCTTQVENYDCLEIQAGESWVSLFPDEQDQLKVKKINRLNTRLRKGMKLAVPKKLKDSKILDFSPFPLKLEMRTEKQIQVNLSLLAWAAYDAEGVLQQWGPISGGKSWCPDTQFKCVTPPGEYEMLYKRGVSCKSRKFPIPKGGAPMPYCMFFTNTGYAMHGGALPGYHASHGCVRLFSEDAKWLNENFIELPNEANFQKGTKVVISSD